jgi:hypothetical protein
VAAGRQHPELAARVRRLAAEIGVFSDFVALDATIALDFIAGALEKGERITVRRFQEARRGSPMGLDITAYSKLTYHSKDKGEDELLGGFVRIYPQPGAHLNVRLDDRKPGVYKEERGSRRFGFRAGSYTGYGEWRELLCQYVHEVKIEEVWEHTKKWAGKPFIELIDFPDNEGTIGPETSAKLAKDFADWDERLKEKSGKAPAGGFDQGNWWHMRYKDWRKAFELAADGGFVTFH